MSCSSWSGCGAVARTRYRRLSGGERQRLGLALALVGRPEVVILDEPTAGMDPEARATTRAIVADLRGDGAAILLTSHDLTDVERLADRIYVLGGGPDRRLRDARRSCAAGVRPRLRFRLDRPLDADEVAGARAGARRDPARDARSVPTATAAATGSMAPPPDAAVVAALAGLVRRRRAADRRAADGRRQPRGRLPRAGRRRRAETGEDVP